MIYIYNFSELSGILEKDFLNDFGQKHNLNMKIVMHQPKTAKVFFLILKIISLKYIEIRG